MTAVETLGNSPRPASRDAFEQHGYTILPALLEPALADFFWSYIYTKFVSLLLLEGDKTVPNTPSVYGDPAFEALLEYLRPQIETVTGCRLYPTFSYFRLYKRGDILKRHRDRPACEISLSLNIGQTPAAPWPLHVEGKTGPNTAILLPGDALIYRGIDCFHWRDPYEGSQLAQVFLHYVDRDGPHADQKFDTRQSLMRPKPSDKTVENGTTINSD